MCVYFRFVVQWWLDNGYHAEIWWYWINFLSFFCWILYPHTRHRHTEGKRKTEREREKIIFLIFRQCILIKSGFEWNHAFHKYFDEMCIWHRRWKQLPKFIYYRFDGKKVYHGENYNSIIALFLLAFLSFSSVDPDTLYIEEKLFISCQLFESNQIDAIPIISIL